MGSSSDSCIAIIWFIEKKGLPVLSIPGPLVLYFSHIDADICLKELFHNNHWLLFGSKLCKNKHWLSATVEVLTRGKKKKKMTSREMLTTAGWIHIKSVVAVSLLHFGSFCVFKWNCHVWGKNIEM